MPNAKFAAGDRVVFLPEKMDSNISRGLYTVIRVLPWETGGYRYRVKGDRDEHERVMSETQLMTEQPGSRSGPRPA